MLLFQAAVSKHCLLMEGAGGYQNASSNVIPIIWLGSHWDDVKQLDVPKEYYGSEVKVLSQDGKVAGGYVSSVKTPSDTLDKDRENDILSFAHGFIWSGDNFGIKNDLGRFSNDESEGAEVKALSSDEKVAGGYFSMKNGSISHGAIWSGDQWEKNQLATWKNDNSGSSVVYALSADGRIAAGFAESDTFIGLATIWLGETPGKIKSILDWNIKK